MSTMPYCYRSLDGPAQPSAHLQPPLGVGAHLALAGPQNGLGAP